MLNEIWVVIVGIGSVAGALAVIPFALDMYKRHADRLHVRAIVDPDDPDLVSVWEMQINHFSRDVADDIEQIRNWVATSKSQRLKGDRQYKFVVLALKHERAVKGYLYAYYYASTATIFLGYIVIDRETIDPADINRAALMLLGRMLQECDATGTPWQHVITEVEADMTSDNRAAKAKLVRFQSAAKKLSEAAGKPPVVVYKLPIDYRQPVLRPEDLDNAASKSLPQWLLFCSRDRETFVSADGATFARRETISSLLKTLLLFAYADAFEDAANYRSYLQREYDRYVRDLPETLKLEHDRRLL